MFRTDSDITPFIRIGIIVIDIAYFKLTSINGSDGYINDKMPGGDKFGLDCELG